MFTFRVAASVIWEGKRRYIPGILAIAFSLILTALQCGIFFGLISTVTTPIIESTADVWVTYPETRAGDLARPISSDWRDVLLSDPDVAAVDDMILSTNYWTTKTAVNDLVVVIGFNIGPNTLGPVGRLTTQQQMLLAEPGSVILDRADKERLGVNEIGDDGQVNRRAVRVVGFIEGMETLTGSVVLCSLETARELLGLPNDLTTFLLVKAKPDANIPALVERINQRRGLTAWTTDGLANQTMTHWISKTKAGIAVAFIAFLGLSVGGAVTSQTLYAATSALVKEFAALRAMGIPRYRMTSLVLTQALSMTIIGILIGVPLSMLLGLIAQNLGTEALMPSWLLGGAAFLTLIMGMISGFIASQSLSHIEPAELLR